MIRSNHRRALRLSGIAGAIGICPSTGSSSTRRLAPFMQESLE